jgi:hypothetical protein
MKPTEPITNSRVRSIQSKAIKLIKTQNIKPGCRTPRRETIANTGATYPSKASWYKIRGELETAVAQARKQLEASNSVTINEADGPQNGTAAANKFLNESSPSPSAVAKRISTQELARNMGTISPAAKFRNRKVSLGRRLSATNEEAVSQAQVA